MGPIYCETPAIVTGFPAEPINTWTNLIIISFGLVALWIIYKRKPHSEGPLAVALLLTATGMGSMLWHGLRTPWALALDTLPGVITLFVLTYYWSRHFLSRTRVWIILVGMLAFEAIGALFLASTSRGGLIFVPFAIYVTILALWLIGKANRVSEHAGTLSAWMITFALAALLARTLDATGAICTLIPVGTHWLWHCLLSLAAFLGILVLITLDRVHEK